MCHSPIDQADRSVGSESQSCPVQGAYRDDDGKPVVLDVVREAEKKLVWTVNHEYLPIGGLKSFTQNSVKLAFGEDAQCIQEGRVAAVQTLSGTGAPSRLDLCSRIWAISC